MHPFSRSVPADRPGDRLGECPRDRLGGDPERHWHTARDERAATVTADEDIDYFLRRPRTLHTHATVRALARTIARCATQPPSAARAEAQGQPVLAATAEAPVRPLSSTTAQAPGRPVSSTTAEGSVQPVSSTTTQAPARPVPSASAEAPGQPGTRLAHPVPLLSARPLAAPFTH